MRAAFEAGRPQLMVLFHSSGHLRGLKSGARGLALQNTAEWPKALNTERTKTRVLSLGNRMESMLAHHKWQNSQGLNCLVGSKLRL